MKLLILAAWVAVLSCVAQAIDWPAGYVVADNTLSPDGRYGILVLDQGNVPAGEEAYEEASKLNYLADLKVHTVLGLVEGARYVNRANHRNLGAVWFGNATAVVRYDGRFGFHSVILLQVSESGMKQSNLGDYIHAALAKICNGSGFVHTRADGQTVRVCVCVTTNPKGMEDDETICAFFGGSYDLTAGKWLSSTARRLSADDFGTVDDVFDDQPGMDDSSDEQATRLDERLNKIYQALRILLPKERFAKLQIQQRTWLKGMEKTGNVERETVRVKARIRVLEDLLWAAL